MSNHWGSHLLNDVIALLRREGVFERLGKRTSQRIMAEMIRRAEEEHDCNPGDILEGHGKALGLCYYCVAPARGLVQDVCPKCRAECGWSEDDLWGLNPSSWATREKPRDGSGQKGGPSGS